MMQKWYLYKTHIEWGSHSTRLVPRPHGPCRVLNDGSVMFIQAPNTYQYNRQHGPAIIYPLGRIVYIASDCEYHRTDGPAIIYENGRKEYWVDDKLMSPDEFFMKYGVL